MNRFQDIELFRHLDRLYPIIKDDTDSFIDLAGVHCFTDILHAMDITRLEYNAWIRTHFPDGKYCVRWTDGTKQWYYYWELHRDDLKPAMISPNGECCYFTNNVRTDEKGNPIIAYNKDLSKYRSPGVYNQVIDNNGNYQLIRM